MPDPVGYPTVLGLCCMADTGNTWVRHWCGALRKL